MARNMQNGGVKGAFAFYGEEMRAAVAGNAYGFQPLDFDASRSNNIYGNNSVQAPAFQTLIIIKIWNALLCTVELFL